MRRPRRNSVAANHCTWRDLTRHLARHINWLHQTTPKTAVSHTRIERWCQQLDSSQAPTLGKPGHNGDLR